MTNVYAAIDQIVITSQIAASAVCDLLDVSRSGFYSWRSGQESVRTARDKELMPIIQEIFWSHKRRYGVRRIVAELNRRDLAVGPARVAKLLKIAGLKAIQPKSFQPKTTQSRHGLGYNANLLANEKGPSGKDQVWVGDITYIPLISEAASRRFGYAAVLMDLFSRRIVGWAYRSSMDERLVLAALRNAIAFRQPEAELIHHSDRGGQYASKEYRAVLRRAEMRQSMSEAGNCYDNAFMESCFGTIKSELELVAYAHDHEAVKELSEYFSYYNGSRRHSGLGYDTPIEFETKHQP